MSQTITINKNGLKYVLTGILIVSLVIGALALGNWFKQQWLILQPPTIATIDTQKLLSEKATLLRDKMANSQTEAEQQAILTELSSYGDRIASWVKTRAPKLCGCLEQPNNCHGRCIVLNQQSVIAGNTVDLTQQFLLEQQP